MENSPQKNLPVHKLLRMESIGEYEIQPLCSCGWRGRRYHRMSDDYAWTNAHDEWTEHRLKEQAK